MRSKQQVFVWLLSAACLGGCDGTTKGDDSEIAKEPNDSPSSSPGNDTLVEACRSPCHLDETGYRTCEERESYPGYSATIDSWSSTRCSKAWQWVVEGECPDGGTLLYFGNGTQVEWRKFDELGKFVALEVSSEGGPDANGCQRTHWPQSIDCDGANVTRTVCGERGPAAGGDPIH